MREVLKVMRNATLVALCALATSGPAFALGQDGAGAADQALNRTYNQLASRLDPSARKKLLTAELAWLKFRDAECAFVVNTSRATDAQQRYAETFTTLTRQRTAQLAAELAAAKLSDAADFTGKYAADDGITTMTLKQTGSTIKGVGFTGIGRSTDGGPSHIDTVQLSGTVTHGVVNFTWQDSWENEGTGSVRQAGAYWVLVTKETHHDPNAAITFGGWGPTRFKETSRAVTEQDLQEGQ